MVTNTLVTMTWRILPIYMAIGLPTVTVDRLPPEDPLHLLPLQLLLQVMVEGEEVRVVETMETLQTTVVEEDLYHP